MGFAALTAAETGATRCRRRGRQSAAGHLPPVRRPVRSRRAPELLRGDADMPPRPLQPGAKAVERVLQLVLPEACVLGGRRARPPTAPTAAHPGRRRRGRKARRASPRPAPAAPRPPRRASGAGGRARSGPVREGLSSSVPTRRTSANRTIRHSTGAAGRPGHARTASDSTSDTNRLSTITVSSGRRYW